MIYVLGRGASGGMKDRAREPGWFWFGVVEWSMFALFGVFIIAQGIFPGLRPA